MCATPYHGESTYLRQPTEIPPKRFHLPVLQTRKEPQLPLSGTSNPFSIARYLSSKTHRSTRSLKLLVPPAVALVSRKLLSRSHHTKARIRASRPKRVLGLGSRLPGTALPDLAHRLASLHLLARRVLALAFRACAPVPLVLALALHLHEHATALALAGARLAAPGSCTSGLAAARSTERAGVAVAVGGLGTTGVIAIRTFGLSAGYGEVGAAAGLADGADFDEALGDGTRGRTGFFVAGWKYSAQ